MKLFLLLCLAACAVTKPVYEHSPLVDQLLYPRPGHEGRLTHSRCASRDGVRCLTWDTLEYDLTDKAARARLIAQEFTCKVGDEQYRVCVELNGLCHQGTNRGWFGKREVKLLHVIDAVKNYGLLLDSNAVCVSAFSDEYANIFQ